MDPCHSVWADYLERLWADDGIRTVLDVCCGSGLMTAELVARGYEVVGIDASDQMLNRARALLGPDVRLERVVLPDLPIDGTFDAAVSTLDGLNYLTLPELRLALARIAERLHPGGWLVFDVHGEAALPFLMDHPVIEGEDDGRSFVLTTVVDPPTRACTTTIELTAPDPADSFTEEHVQYVHSAQDIQGALVAAAFIDVRVTDEYTDEPVGPGTLRTTWTARRAR